MPKPKLGSLDSYFNKNPQSFKLTDTEYEKLCGLRLPKNISYLKKDSALAKYCKAQGYKLDVQEKFVTITKM